MEMKVFVFSVEDFKFVLFYEKETNHDKSNFKRGLAVAFNVKTRNITGKIGFQFCKLTFLGVSDQALCKFV